MTTTAQRFYPHSTEWDGTDPASGDVRKCETSLPAVGAGSSCDFGSSGAKTITVDPYTTGRTTTGLSSAFGWAIDIAGADGMDGTATAKRIIPAGAWLYQGTLFASPALALANCTVAMSVYRVAASPSTTRTLLFTDAGVAVAAVATTGTGFTRTTASQSLIELEAGETIQVTFTLTCTGQVGGLVIALRTGAQATDCLVDVPTPGVRTNNLVSVVVTGVGTAQRQAQAVAHAVSVAGVGTVAVARQTVAAKTITVTGVGTVSRSYAVTMKTITVTGVGTVNGKAEMALGRIPDSSDYSGSDPSMSIEGVVYDSAGAPVAGATVKLFRQADDAKVASTTSGADGSYSFTRDAADPNTYWVHAFSDGEHHGTSDRSIAPS